ncbi:hypothetical protein AWV80_09760 [Cupriavidus sp. UYMU48A]|nr:hypothetical protein AWV80_09760 [Cupriavidus sp. UYMU48A]
MRDSGEPADPPQPCEPVEVAEVLVRGPCMMRDCLNRPDANARVLPHGCPGFACRPYSEGRQICMLVLILWQYAPLGPLSKKYWDS